MISPLRETNHEEGGHHGQHFQGNVTGKSERVVQIGHIGNRQLQGVRKLGSEPNGRLRLIMPGARRTGGVPFGGPRSPVSETGETTANETAKAPELSMRTVFARFWPYTRRFRWLFVLTVVLGLMLPVLQGVAIWMFKVLVDEVLVPRDLGAFWGIAGIYGGITVAVGFFAFFGSYLSRWLTENFVLDLRTDLFRHLHTLSLDVLGRSRLGDLLSRLTEDVTAVQQLVVSGVTRSVGNILRVVLFAGALFVLRWELALVALGIAPLFWLAARAFSLRLKAASREARHRSGAMSAIAEESLANAPLVQTYQQQDAEVRRFHTQGQAKLRARLTAGRLGASFGPLVDALELIGVLAVVGLGTWQMSAGRLSLGGLLAFIAYLSQLYQPIRSLSRMSNTIYTAAAGAERISELLSSSTSVPELPGARQLGRARGEVQFDRVHFGYPEAPEKALEDVSFTVDPGEVLALAGPSGAGKTTVVKLVARLYDASGGTVSIDGHDVRELTLDAVRSNVAVLLQETLVFHGSIYDNIAYGRHDVTADEVRQAARRADVVEFTDRLPEGLATVIGERGSSLSGGQRQRIAIARALIRDAPILILDEPSAGLDHDTWERVLTPLRRLMEGRATIVIAHDQSSLALADRILLLEHGRVHRPSEERIGSA